MYTRQKVFNFCTLEAIIIPAEQNKGQQEKNKTQDNARKRRRQKKRTKQRTMK